MYISITICGDRYIPKILSQAMAPGHGGPQEQPRLPEWHRAPADRHRHEGGWAGGFKNVPCHVWRSSIYIYIYYLLYIYTYILIYTFR